MPSSAVIVPGTDISKYTSELQSLMQVSTQEDILPPSSEYTEVKIEVDHDQVTLDGITIGERHGDFVGSNMMVTPALGSFGSGSTASVPNEYSSIGAVVQLSLGSGTRWYYVKDINRNSGSSPFSGKQKVSVSWELPLLSSQDYRPVQTSSGFALVPPGQNIHAILRGDIALPGKFIVYSSLNDDTVASSEIASVEQDCSAPTRCSADLDTSSLSAGYYYVVYTWNSGGTDYISNSFPLMVGNPGRPSSNSGATLVLEDARTGKEEILAWQPMVVQDYGAIGKTDKENINVYQWTNNNAPGISIGTSTSPVTYRLERLNLDFQIVTDWSSHTRLVFASGKTIDLVAEDETVTLVPSTDGEWVGRTSLTVAADGKSLIISAGGEGQTTANTDGGIALIEDDATMITDAAENNQTIILLGDSSLAQKIVQACGQLEYPTGENAGVTGYQSSMLVQLVRDEGNPCPLTAGNNLVIYGETSQTLTDQTPVGTSQEPSQEETIPYTPKYQLTDWSTSSFVASAEKNAPTVKLSALQRISFDSTTLGDLQIEKDTPEPVLIGVKEISDSKIQFYNVVGTGNARYAWDFGDGATSDEQSPAYDFKTSGTHVVTLRTTDEQGHEASQSFSVTVEKVGFFQKIWRAIFGSDTRNEEPLQEISTERGGLVMASSTGAVRIAHDGNAIWGTSDSSLATVDQNGIVTFSEAFKNGNVVGIVMETDDEKTTTFFQYTTSAPYTSQLVVVSDSLSDATTRPPITVLSTSKETLDDDLILATSIASDDEISDEGTEAIGELAKNGGLDAVGELLKLGGDEWAEAYDLLRKIYEGGKTVSETPSGACECLEKFRDFLRSQDEAEAKLNFWNYCFCMYSMTGNDAVSLLGYYACFGIGDRAPDPTALPADVLSGMLHSIGDSLNECKDPGYLERRTRSCTEAKKDCDEAKALIEKAKQAVTEAKTLAEEARRAFEQSRQASQKASDALQQAYAARTTQGAQDASRRATQAAREAEHAADIAREKTEESAKKRDEASQLFQQAATLCPGKCSPEDGSAEVIRAVSQGQATLAGMSSSGYVEEQAARNAGEAGANAQIAIDFALQKKKTEQKKNCEKALALAQAALKTAQMTDSVLNVMRQKTEVLSALQTKMASLELTADNIRKNERFERGIRLNDIARQAAIDQAAAEKIMANLQGLQDEVSKLADEAKKIAAAAQAAMAEGDPQDPDCVAAAQIIRQALDTADQAITAASNELASAQESLDAIHASKQHIDKIRDDWEKKRRTIRVYTYVNAQGQTVIWGGNGDAQPPPGATYHGTMQNGRWIDGGPPPIS